jgi:hypothetical protein
MTCEGPGACEDVTFTMSQEKGTLTCKGGIEGQQAVCDDSQGVAASVICDGPNACNRNSFKLNFEQGTLTCKGGTKTSPAYTSGLAAYVGCLICEDPFSCTAFTVATPDGILSYPDGFFFQGSFGRCPKDKKATSLPCFSGSNFVEVQDKGIMPMDALQTGDLVKTGINEDGKSQNLPVISSMHMNPHAEVEFRQIYSNVSPTVPLEISNDHFLYLHDDKVVRARDVQVGDILKGDGTSGTVVTYIQNIQRKGLYAPATENGKIWVSGVTASSYIALMDDDIMSPNMQIVLSHMALSPLRMVCSMGSFSICQNETYSEDGYSMNLWMLIQFGHHFLTLTKHLQLWMLVAVAPLLLVVGGMELALYHGMWASMLTVGLVVTMKTIMTNKTIAKK